MADYCVGSHVQRTQMDRGTCKCSERSDTDRRYDTDFAGIGLRLYSQRITQLTTNIIFKPKNLKKITSVKQIINPSNATEETEQHFDDIRSSSL